MQRPKPQIVAFIYGPFRPRQPPVSRRRRHVPAVLAHYSIEIPLDLLRAHRADDGLPGHTANLALAAFGAFGAALGEAVEVDPRRRGGVASSKGTLSA